MRQALTITYDNFILTEKFIGRKIQTLNLQEIRESAQQWA